MPQNPQRHQGHRKFQLSVGMPCRMAQSGYVPWPLHPSTEPTNGSADRGCLVLVDSLPVRPTQVPRYEIAITCLIAAACCLMFHVVQPSCHLAPSSNGVA